jgi:hypothetical protein
MVSGRKEEEEPGGNKNSMKVPANMLINLNVKYET